MKEENINEKIAKNIRNLRELKGYTQEYVANELGMEQPNYSLIEKGRKPITFELAQNIASVLDTTLEALQKFDSSVYFNNCKGNGFGQNNTNHFHFSEEVKELKNEMKELKEVVYSFIKKQ